MKFNRRIISKITLSVIICLLAIPISFTFATEPKSSQDKTEITFWYTENDQEKQGVLDLVTEFETMYEDIDVEAIQISFFDARSLYTTSYIAKTECDVMRATRDWIPEFAASEMILPLTDTFNSSDLEDFLNISIEMVTYPDANGDDQIWAYPQLVDTPAIMYNVEIFENAGIDTSTLAFNTSWSWEEYWGILMKVNGTEYTYEGETRNVYATTLAGMMFGAQPYYFGNGAKMFENDTVSMETAAIDSTEARGALEFLKNLTDSTVTPNWLDQGWGPLNPSFRTGLVAMINQGPWELRQNIKDEAIFEGGDNLGIVQLPHDEEGNRGAPVGMHGYILSSHIDPTSDTYDAAVKLARFMSSEHAQAEGAIGYYHVPSRQSVMDREDVQTADSFKYVEAFWQSTLSSFRVPVSHNWAQLEADFGDRINEYLADELSLDECIARTLVLWSEYVPELPPWKQATNTTEEAPPGISGYAFWPLLGLMAISVIGLFHKNRS